MSEGGLRGPLGIARLQRAQESPVLRERPRRAPGMAESRALRAEHELAVLADERGQPAVVAGIGDEVVEAARQVRQARRSARAV
jgi:hypothetical protein